ncbi:AraC family transcriptional regulator, partial [Pseudomonas sp. JV245A]|nr:AraC family transcriptional regulator [Pseudomonas sp. JV245A]
MPSLGFTSVPPLLKYLLYAEQLGIATEPALAAAGLSAA